jgi:hypothetical protein
MEFLSTIFHAAWPFILGAAGWFVTEFVARPFLKFFDLRTQVKRSMILLWDAPTYGMQEDDEEWADEMAPFKESRDGLTKLAAEVSAFAQSGSSVVWIVRMLGYDPLGAGKAAKKLTFELGTNIEDRDKNYRKLDTTLKFRFDAKRPFYNPYNPGH